MSALRSEWLGFAHRAQQKHAVTNIIWKFTDESCCALLDLTIKIDQQDQMAVQIVSQPRNVVVEEAAKYFVPPAGRPQNLNVAKFN